jgi:hypothetical protein
VPGITPPNVARDGVEAPASFADSISASLEVGAARAGNTGSRPALLSLSGGSLNGAYGAGYLDEWRKMSGPAGLPRFVNVTGISTGAILATYAFTGQTSAAVAGYSITREDQLLKPYVKMKNGDIPLAGYATLVRKGALGDLAPLRDRLHEAFTSDILKAVADGAADGRTLFVGVVDVDAGEAEAIDLTEMASRWARATDDRTRLRWKSCYVEAVLASSSAPLAAKPVFIDNREYIDGGARFGMFSYGFAEAVKAFRSKPRPGRVADPVQYLIINGDQRIEPDCRVEDKTVCTEDNPTGGVDRPHRKWSLLKLALRSEKILANQVYRFSESMVADGAPGSFRSTLIRDDVDTYSYRMDHPVLGSGTRTCREWRAIDRQRLDPIQFAPRYMWCLIDYGRARARRDNWAAS